MFYGNGLSELAGMAVESVGTGKAQVLMKGNIATGLLLKRVTCGDFKLN